MSRSTVKYPRCRDCGHELVLIGWGPGGRCPNPSCGISQPVAPQGVGDVTSDARGSGAPECCRDCGGELLRQGWGIPPTCVNPPCCIPQHDPVTAPSHYTQGSIECIDAIEAALGRDGFIAFLRGQVIKYSWRLGLKGPALEDAQKAFWYQDRLTVVLQRAC